MLEELNKEIAEAQVAERHSNTVYIFKLHEPTCAYTSIVVFFSIIQFLAFYL